MSDNQLISIDKCTKMYGDFCAVKDLSFTVNRGEVVGFLGPNGAGKTTTMKLITGYLCPSSGKILVANEAVSSDSLSTREKIGYLPENAPLYDDMMVDEFLDFVGNVRHLKGDLFKKRKAIVIERCGLAPVLGKDIGALSKGYRQRVGLAQAIIHDPPILILDEPTSGLDPNQIVDIRALIKELGQDKTVILSTHILPEVQATCNRVLIINQGQLVADDTPDHLLASQGATTLEVGLLRNDGSAASLKEAEEVLGKLPGLTAIKQLAAADNTLRILISHQDGDPRLALFQAIAKSQLALVELTPHKVSLEETFRHLTLQDENEDNKQ